MPNITPSQLPLLGGPITDNAIFIVQQGGIVAKVPFSALHAIVKTALESYIDSQFQSTYSDVQSSISALVSQLGQKADTVHTHGPSGVGLGNVENIAPLDMPISIALQEALDDKVNVGECGMGEELEINGGDPPEW